MSFKTCARFSRRTLLSFSGTLVIALVGWCAGGVQAGVIYFADIFDPGFDNGSIRRVNTDGSGLQTLITTGGGLRGLDVDPLGSKMYWTDVNTPSIRRANLDGSAPESVVTGGLEFPSAIALDASNDRMYWGDQVSYQLRRAHLDGSGPQTLRSTPFHRGVAIDHTNNKIYWSTSIDLLKGQIVRSNLDGSTLETVVTSINPEFKPADVAIDIAGGKVYWTDYVVDIVRRANLDGSNIEDLYAVGSNRNPRGIALDLDEGKVYWGQDEEISGTTGKIMRMNLDGSLPEDAITGLGLVNDLAIIPEPATIGLLLLAAAAFRAARR